MPTQKRTILKKTLYIDWSLMYLYIKLLNCNVVLSVQIIEL